MNTHTSDKTNEFSFIVAPSLIKGVGVFATHDIKQNTVLQIFSDEDSRFISNQSPLMQDINTKKFCEWYCIATGDGYFCPASFSSMDIGWYLNHSQTPNTYQKNYVYYALQDIKKGEEITIDYGTLSENDQLIKSEFHSDI